MIEEEARKRKQRARKMLLRLGTEPVVQQEHAGFSCNICDKNFQSKQNLKAHMSTHGKGKKFVCETQGCGKKYTTRGNLKTHQKRAHGTESAAAEEFVCDVEGCSDRFPTRRQLQRHIGAQHTLDDDESQNPTCKFCARELPLGTNVNHERNCRDNPKNKDGFACDLCGKILARKDYIKDHKKIHHGIGKDDVKCEECGQLFLTRARMWTHMKKSHRE